MEFLFGFFLAFVAPVLYLMNGGIKSSPKEDEKIYQRSIDKILNHRLP